MHLKAIVVDDEAHARESLQLLLQRGGHAVEVVAEARDLASAKEALEALHRAGTEPELCFLDIELSGESGFDVLEHLPASTAVVFVTAYNEYALKALRAKALDYLLKPVDPEELSQALEKVRDRMETQRGKGLDGPIVEELMRRIDGEAFSGIAVPSKGGMDILEADNILRCASESNYTHLYLMDGRRMVVTKTLKEVEAMLPAKRFMRIHHSHLINLKGVRKIWKEDGLLSVELKDGSRCPVSRSRKEAFLAVFR